MWRTFLFFFVSAAMPFAAEDPKPLAIGSPAPAFELPGIDGERHRLADYEEDVLALVFTCNHCPTAQAYESRLKQMVTDYQDKSVAIVAISPNAPEGLRLDEQGYSIVGDTLEDMKIHAETYGFNFPYLYDGETQTVARAYGVIATPHVFIVDRERVLRYQGRIDDDESGDNITSHTMREAIDALLAGKEVPLAETRVFGCSTKWASKDQARERADQAWAQRPVSLEGIGVEGMKALAENKTDKLRLINVWATWCGPCVSEFPELVKLTRMYARRGFELITLSVDDEENEEVVRKFLVKEQAAVSEATEASLKKEGRKTNNYLFLGKDKEALAEAIDPEWRGGYPHSVLIAPGGKVLYRQSGEIDPLELRKAIVSYLGRTYSGRQWQG